MESNRLPFGAQFSPNQVDLPKLLEIIYSSRGNRNAITEAIRSTFFASHAADNSFTLADNTVLALREYGLLDELGANPTTFCDELKALSNNLPAMYDTLAKHILLNLNGIVLIETIEDMHRAGEQVTLNSLQKRLKQRGVDVPRGDVRISSLRLWLAKAHVFDPSIRGSDLYKINHNRVNELLGVELDEIDRLTQLTVSQRAYLRALLCITEPDPLVANKVADHATMLYAVEYNHKELPKSTLEPLQRLGLIDLQKSTGGKGAKPYLVYRTEKFYHEISEPLLSAVARKSGLAPRYLFGRPLRDILKDLDSPNKNTKGQALELLVIYLARLIDLEFKGWRTRSVDTGGAEVDVILEGTRLIFSRWQIQAKNMPLVRLDDVAKEVGLSLTFIYSNVVVVVSTGRFTRDAYDYAKHVMKTSNLNVILLEGSDLRRIAVDPTEIVSVLTNKAEQAMQLKERSDYFRAQ